MSISPFSAYLTIISPFASKRECKAYSELVPPPGKTLEQLIFKRSSTVRNKSACYCQFSTCQLNNLRQGSCNVTHRQCSSGQQLSYSPPPPTPATIFWFQDHSLRRGYAWICRVHPWGVMGYYRARGRGLAVSSGSHRHIWPVMLLQQDSN